MKIVAFGAVTGLRSMAGVATLARSHRQAGPILALATAGEMVADKTPWVADRVGPLPLLGRAALGAAAGAFIAREQHGSPWFGAVVGGTSAVVVAHVAWRARKECPRSNVAGGILEDALVLGVASLYA